MRKIEPAMVDYIDSKLEHNGLAIEAVKQKDARLLFRLAAEACVGIREKGGNNQGPLVKLLQETIGNANGEAWCMSTVQTMLAYAEVKTGVKSPIIASEHCLTVWKQSPVEQRVKLVPGPGAICIWQHGGTSQGHTGVVTSYKDPVMYLVEGNTNSGLNDDGSLERDGGGVYYTKRNVKANGTMHVIGFLKPF